MAGPDQLVDLIFDKEQPESVDFEIAFTALVATATLSTLNSEVRHSLVISLCALGLLVLTLVRRMGIIGDYADAEPILNKTVRPIELFTIVCVIQICITVLRGLGEWATGIYVVAGVLIAVVLFVVVLQELVFGDYRIWWGSAFFTKGLAIQNGLEDVDSLVNKVMLSVFKEFHFDFAHLVLKEPGVIPEEDVEKWNTLREFVEGVDENERSRPSAARTFFGSGVVLAIGYGGVSWILSFTGFPVLGGLLLLTSIMAVRHLIGFWYLAYGSQTLSRFLQGNTYHLATMGVYGGVIYWLFFYTV